MTKDKKIKSKIAKNISFSELLEKHPEAIDVLMDNGMHCIGCPMSQMESLEQGCLAHGLDVDKIIKEINEKLKK